MAATTRTTLSRATRVMLSKHETQTQNAKYKVRNIWHTCHPNCQRKWAAKCTRQLCTIHSALGTRHLPLGRCTDSLFKCFARSSGGPIKSELLGTAGYRGSAARNTGQLGAQMIINILYRYNRYFANQSAPGAILRTSLGNWKVIKNN